jgi:hypothetical protein
MTTITTVNPFATAEAFADFPVPHDLQHGHLGSYAHTMSVSEVRKAHVRIGEWAGEVWTRSAEADASTPFRTVILNTMDVATDDTSIARKVLRAALLRFNQGDERSVEWMMDRAKTDFHPGFIRLMWVEDLS